MTLILNGDTGLSDVDGSAATPAIRGTDTNTGIFFPAADTIAFSEGGAEVGRFDSSGSLLVGGTTGTAGGKLTVTTANAGYVAVEPTSSVTNQIATGLRLHGNINETDRYVGIFCYNGAANNVNSMTFWTSSSGSSAEQARITNTGLFQFNSGYGSVATAYGCRAWVNFNGAANSNISGTYSQSGTAITVTAANHGLSAGQSVYLTFSTGTATAELCTVASVTSTSVFVATSATSRTTSGNCTLNFQTIRASGNVSSVTDNGTGIYTVNFTNAMPDANYAIMVSGGGTSTAIAPRLDNPSSVSTTNTGPILFLSTSFSPLDNAYAFVSIFR